MTRGQDPTGRTGEATDRPRRGTGPKPTLRARRGEARRYGVVLGVTVPAVAVGAYAAPRLGVSLFLLLVPVVVFCSWYAGFGPGILSGALSAVGANLLLYLPRSSPEIRITQDAVELGVFLLVAVLVGSTNERLRRQRERAARAYEVEFRARDRAARLADASHLMASSLDLERTLEDVGRILVEALGDFCIVDLVEEDGTVRRVATAHADSDDGGRVEALRAHPPDPSGAGPVARTLRTRTPSVWNDVSEELLRRMAAGDEHLQLLRRLDPRAVLTVPMVAREEVLGTITVAATRREARYDDDDVAFALQLADRAALAVDNARLYGDARAAVRMREDVLAVVSHDLRDLLSSAYGSAELLLEPWLSDDRRQSLIRRQLRVLRRADRLIDDLLAAARGATHTADLAVEPLAAGELLREAVEPFREQAEAEGVEITLEAGEPVPPVAADRHRVLRVLSNLLSNALRYGAGGGRVEVAVEANDELAIFRVSDDGPGVSPEDHDRLFERFWRGERSEGKGLGLGLAIARDIVEAHGGRIWVESAPGQGCTFRFSLPLTGAEGAGSAPVEPTTPSGDAEAPSA